jgi:cytosine deaminase
MRETVDFLVRNVRRYDADALVDIAIAKGRIVHIGKADLSIAPARSLDLEGYLVSPAFVEPHYHLDKCFVADVSLPEGTLEEQLAASSTGKTALRASHVAERATRMGRLLAGRGVTMVRSFADIDEFAELRILEGLREAKRRLEGIIDLQIVAFPQHGLFTHAGTFDLIVKALESGVDAVGGHPQLENGPENAHRQVRTVFELCRAYDVDADFHVDETDDPSSRWMEETLRVAIEFGWEGRLNLAHCCSLPKQNTGYRESIYALLKAAGATIVSSPTSGLLFRGYGDHDPPRGITTVREIIERGINVAIGQELYQSVFSRHLRFPDPLFTGQLMAYLAKLADDSGLMKVHQMLTLNPAKSLRMKDYGLSVGDRADLVFLKASSIGEALTLLAPERLVLKGGQLVSRSRYCQSTWDPEAHQLSPLA